MSIVVLGGGLAAANAVEELRTEGYDGEVTLVGAEPHLPYERPPLSKGLLLDDAEPDSVMVHDEQWYADRDVTLMLGTTALAVEPERRRVRLTTGELDYDQLLLATGASPRRLPEVESSAADVLYLRTLDDALRLRARLAGQVLVVGAGWIGLEVAAAARHAGAAVTVLETAPLPLLGVLGPEVAPIFADLHRENGVDVRLGTRITAVDGRRFELSTGDPVEADLVVVGIGAAPNDELASRAGLGAGNGVAVDARLRTSDSRVFAAGDVARHDHPVLGPLRVEHWDNAIEQGKHVARSLLGDGTPYTRLPYFFSDQYDVGLEYVGHVGAAGYDEVAIRGDVAKRQLVVTWRRDGRTVAGMHLNQWDAIDDLRQAIGQPAIGQPAVGQPATSA